MRFDVKGAEIAEWLEHPCRSAYEHLAEPSGGAFVRWRPYSTTDGEVGLSAMSPRNPHPVSPDALVVLRYAELLELLDREYERIAAADYDPERLLDRAGLGRRLDVSVATIDRLVRDDGLPYLRVGDVKRFRWPAVLAWLEREKDK